MAPNGFLVAAALLLALSLNFASGSVLSSLSTRSALAATTDAKAEVQARFDACLTRVQTRCHSERDRCERDCAMYQEDPELKCKPNKCRLVHRACHRLYREACEDFHPVKWIPLNQLEGLAEKSQNDCKSKVTQRCDRRRQVCKTNCQDDVEDQALSFGPSDDLCSPLRCELVHSDCFRVHNDICHDVRSFIIADQTPGKYCALHPDTCTRKSFVSPQVIDSCEDGCTQGESWSVHSTCEKCQQEVNLCYDNCKGGICQPRHCYANAELCRQHCPFVPAVKASDAARTDLVKPKTTKINCGCGSSSSGSSSCFDSC